MVGECLNMGVIFCSDGVTTFRANRVGNMTGAGGVAVRGSASFYPTAEAWSKLNGKYHTFTYVSDLEGDAE